MRKLRLTSAFILLLCLFIFYIPALPAYNEGPKAELPVLVTACGQCPDDALIKVILMRAKFDHKPKAYEVNSLAAPEDLIKMKEAGTPYKTIIIVMGSSLKGMGAAGISMDDELARTASLIEEAKKQSITLIGAHIGGMKRRAQGAAVGDNTDELSIDAVAPLSDILLIRKDGDSDSRFTTIANAKNIPMIVIEKNLDLLEEVKKIFSK